MSEKREQAVRSNTDASLDDLLNPDPDDDTTAIEPVEQADSMLDDDDFLPEERQRAGRLTVSLIVALVLAVGVLGGVWVQQQLGGSAAASGFPSGPPAGMPAGPGGPAKPSEVEERPAKPTTSPTPR